MFSFDALTKICFLRSFGRLVAARAQENDAGTSNECLWEIQLPHVLIEMTDNIERWAHPRKVVEAVHEAACSSGDLPTGAIKTRAIRHSDYAIGTDENGLEGFITVLIRIRPGRSDAIMKGISDAVHQAVIGQVTPIAGRQLNISVDLQLIDPVAAVQSKH
jgi:5-carboxymethyl-2-hydroxymuconate isomerase